MHNTYVIVITHPLGLCLICKHDAKWHSQRAEYLQIKYKQNGAMLQLFCFIYV